MCHRFVMIVAVENAEPSNRSRQDLNTTPAVTAGHARSYLSGRLHAVLASTEELCSRGNGAAAD